MPTCRITLAVALRWVDQVVTVSDAAIAEAAIHLLNAEHLLVEWSGAAAVAALLSNAVPALPTPAVAVLSGGNVDPQAIIDGQAR